MRDINPRDIRPFTGNADIFRDLSGDEYAVLRDSIAEHGIITPLVVTQDNVLIAGHQRLRVAQELGLDTVPCVVRQVANDTELELLLIEDNVRRRHLSPYEFAKAVKRAYELNGIRHGGDRQESDSNSCLQDIADSFGVSKFKVKEARTLAELIPSFGELLDAKRITREVATHLAQLPHDAQVALYDDWDAGWKHAHADALKKLKDEYKDTMKALTKKQKEAEECAKRYEAELADAKRALEEAEESEPDHGDEVRAQIEAEYESQIEKLNELAELQTKLRNVLKNKPTTPTVKAKSLGMAAGEWRTEPAPRDGTLILSVWEGEDENEYEAVLWDTESECWSTGGDSEPIAWAPIFVPREN